MATVGVLCARGRVEEKALMAALAHAGIVSALFPPADEPLPVSPLQPAPAGRPFPVPQLVVDRHPNRQIARAVLAACQALGVPALSGGVAATGDRLDVASALAAHGLPRPLTALCTSEDAALQAVTAQGLPATLLPLDLQSPGVTLLDIDAAEAVLEHRAVLGGSNGALGLVQAGAPGPASMASVIVVSGKATALTVAPETAVPDAAVALAEEAARVLRADIIAITVAAIARETVVWDVQPVPEFRHALSISGTTVADAIAEAVQERLAVLSTAVLPGEPPDAWLTLRPERIPGGIVVSA
jgi:glutathione synthase/RimK-type ligase-like ATP-grasp enzyme